MDTFSNTLQYFYHTSVSSAVAIKLLNWCVSSAAPVQETVLWNISFEVLMYPLSINLAGAKEEQGAVSRGSDACAGCPAGFASWEVLPTFFYLCWTICKSQRLGQSCVSFWCHSTSSWLLRSRLQAALASQCWKHRVQSSSPMVFFSPRKSSLGSTLFYEYQWVVLALLGAGGTSGRQVEGRDTLSCLQCLLPAGAGSQPWGRGCRAEPPSLPWTDLIFQSHLPRCPWALTYETQSCLKTEKYLWGPQGFMSLQQNTPCVCLPRATTVGSNGQIFLL